MKRKDVEGALLDYGTKRGVLTFDELNEAFPAEYFPLQELERFLMRLEGLGVKVVERAERRRNRQRHKQAA
jgi:RNA polymerase primary sigma factor